MRYLTALLAACLYVVSFAFDVPCLDPLACNFMEEGECFFTDENGDPCVIEGCTIEGACNYDPEADIYDGSCEFVSCLGCTDSEACNFDETALYDDASCIYYVDCNGTCGGDWIEDACGNCFDSTPSISEEAISAMDGFDLVNSTFNLDTAEYGYSGFIEVVEIPEGVEFAYVEVRGARGGGWQTNCFENATDGGSPVIIQAIIDLREIDSLNVLVGGAGSTSSIYNNLGSGGGASAVYSGVIPLAIAGGGGGAGDDCTYEGYLSSMASFLETGNAGAFCDDLGESGQGGVECCGGNGQNGAGGGFFGGDPSGPNGQSILQGGQGGQGEINGGFGGGGAACGACNSGQGYGGGGGGFSGGGLQCNDDAAGGGGTYCDAVGTYSIGLFQGDDENGSVMIVFISGASPECNPGCTYPQACNYNPESNFDDGSCDYCFCGEGTQWVDSLQACMVTEAALMQACGDGTYWDDALSACVPSACFGDFNGDGMRGTEDLLQFLTVFDTPCPFTVSAFSCGDLVGFDGYDYQTVQIGSQCWFKENLRTEHYANGDEIPGNLSDSEWTSTSSGAQAVYGEGTSDCIFNCDEVQNLEDYGRLYNWYAVDDSRGLCPSGWHVPTDGEWMTLEMEMGMSESEANSTGYRGTDQGTQMKSSASDTPSWNGSNTSGFSALPGGLRDYGNNAGVGNYGYWWSASPEGSSHAWYRTLYSDYGNVNRNNVYHLVGFSVRCVRDE